MLKLRPPDPRDLDAFYAISLATGLAGDDASRLYEDGRLIGHIYSAPYACLAPDLAVVAEDDDGIGGFVVGAVDTLSWESRLERVWWPEQRTRYPFPAGEPSVWTADERRRAMIHRPEHTPANIARDFPAHVHLNLLPRLQGRGVGVSLLGRWLELARERAVEAVHVGVNSANSGALRFWTRQGFCELVATGPTTRTIWMGRRLID